MKLELDNDHTYNVVVAAKKCYCVYHIENGTEVIHDKWFKIKGVKAHGDEKYHDRIIPEEDVYKVKTFIDEDNHIAISNLYDSYQSARSLTLMRNILNKRVAHILCLHIRKNLRSFEEHKFVVRGEYVIKTLPRDVYSSF